MSRVLLALTLVAALAACNPPAVVQAQVADVTTDVAEDAQAAVAAPVEEAQTLVAAVLAPATVAVEAAVAAALPPPPPAEMVAPEVSPAAVELIVAFEIVSPAYYTKRL